MTRPMDSPNRSAGPRCAWASITEGTRNIGNFLIEWYLRRAVALPEPAIVFDSFRPLPPAMLHQINQTCRFLISPGCTTLQVGQNPAFESFNQITIPKPCFGGCVWAASKSSRLVQAARMFGPPSWTMRYLPTAPPDTRIAGYMSQPVGTRDPYTQQVLTRAGYQACLVGCPTLLTERPAERWRPISGRRLVVSFSRFSLPSQLALVRRLQRTWDVTVMLHESYEAKILKAVPGLRCVEFQSPEQFLSHYAQADVVLTGRLHGALPAIGFGTRVVFYGNASDTRFSLLAYLGIPIRPLSMGLAALNELPEVAAPAEQVFERLFQLRQSFAAYAKAFGFHMRVTS